MTKKKKSRRRPKTDIIENARIKASGSAKKFLKEYYKTHRIASKIDRTNKNLEEVNKNLIALKGNMKIKNDGK